MRMTECSAKYDLFQTCDLGDGIFMIKDVVGVEMYLIEGDDKAILLDTGIGIGKLRDIVTALTDKPTDVYLTHGHVDHAGGIYNFDEVWLAEADISLLQRHTTKNFRLDFAGAYIPELKDIEDIKEHMPWHNHIELHNVSAETKIGLGNRSLIVIDMKGHTQGSIGFYDEKTKTLFAGDGCNNSTFLFLEEAATVAEYKATLTELKNSWLNRIDRLIICHEYIELPTNIINDLIECCDLVLNDEASGEEFIIPYVPFQNGHSYWAVKGASHREKTDGKYGNLIYNSEKIQ